MSYISPSLVAFIFLCAIIQYFVFEMSTKSGTLIHFFTYGKVYQKWNVNSFFTYAFTESGTFTGSIVVACEYA